MGWLTDQYLADRAAILVRDSHVSNDHLNNDFANSINSNDTFTSPLRGSPFLNDKLYFEDRSLSTQPYVINLNMEYDANGEKQVIAKSYLQQRIFGGANGANNDEILGGWRDDHFHGNAGKYRYVDCR